MNRVAATLLSAAALAAPSCAPEQRCTIVFDGTSQRVFNHELAHCNGWEHDLDKPDPPTPRRYLYDFPGQLKLLVCGKRLRARAQADAAIQFEDCQVSKRCIAMMTEYGMNIGFAGHDRIRGCAFND